MRHDDPPLQDRACLREPLPLVFLQVGGNVGASATVGNHIAATQQEATMANQKKKGEALPAITDVLDTLKSRRQKLDEADTRISDLIKDVESALEAHFNIRVWTDITDYEKNGWPTVLAFGKHDGKWQLVIEVEFPDGADSKTPLQSCSRDTRLRAFVDGHVEDLIRGAVTQLDKQLEVREKAIDKASELVRALGGIPF